MSDKPVLLTKAIKQQIPSATFDHRTRSIRVGFNRAGLSDPTILTDIFKYAAAVADLEFDGYDEDGSAVFIL